MTETFILEIRPSPTAHARALLSALVVDEKAATLAFGPGAFPFEIRLHAHRHREGVIVRVMTVEGTIARSRLRPGWRKSEFVYETARVLTRALRRLAARHETLRRETLDAISRLADIEQTARNRELARERGLEEAMRERLARRDHDRERRKSRRPEPGFLTRVLRRLRLV